MLCPSLTKIVPVSPTELALIHLLSLSFQMLHTKGLNYPGAYPIQRSPPLFICSSPGPEPYRSNDNVYEELEHRGSSRYQNCDRQLHSDEDFAEDELSLGGDRSMNKSSSDNTTVATIYQEHGIASGSTSGNENTAMYMERNRVERNSLLSSASSNNDNSNNHINSKRPNMRISSSCTEPNSRHVHHHQILNSTTTDKNGNSSMSNFFRFRTSRPTTNGSSKSKGSRGKGNNFSMNNLNSSGGDEIPLASYHVGGSSSSAASNSDPISCSSMVNGNHIETDTINNNSNNNIRNNYYGIDSEVERRNRINAQLSAAAPTLNVATIYRDRNSMRNYQNTNNNGSNTTETRANANYYVPQQHIRMMAANRNDANNRLSRTNPRTDRRRSNNNNSSSNNNNSSNEEYLYHEPVYPVYDPYIISSTDNRNQIYHQPYMVPEFTTFRHYNNLNNPHLPIYNASMTTTTVNSDSGYSQNTQNSGRSVWSRRKRGTASNNNESNEASDGLASTTGRDEMTATDEAYEGS